MYFVLHSTDPYLLARMCTDLQMQGWYYPENWEWHNPFVDDPPYEWLAVDGIDMRFHNHSCLAPDTRFTLTSKNYLKVLETILESKK
mgnify:FL=1